MHPDKKLGPTRFVLDVVLIGMLRKTFGRKQQKSNQREECAERENSQNGNSQMLQIWRGRKNVELRNVELGNGDR